MKIDIDFTETELAWIKNALGSYRCNCPQPSREEVKKVYEKYKDWYWWAVNHGDEDYYAQND